MSIEKEYCDFCGGLTVDDTVPDACNGECLVVAELDAFEELDFSNDPATNYCENDLLQSQTDFDSILSPVDMDKMADDQVLLINQLQHELNATRESLQTVIEELQATNEELQSANEELQSANEELLTVNDDYDLYEED